MDVGATRNSLGRVDRMAECSIDCDGATNAHAAETTINIQKIDLASSQQTAEASSHWRERRKVRFGNGVPYSHIPHQSDDAPRRAPWERHYGQSTLV